MTRVPRIPTLVLLLATALSAPSQGQVVLRAHLPLPADVRVAELLRAARGDTAPPEEETVVLLRAEVPAALDQVGRILATRRVPAVAEGEVAQVLSAPQRALLARALEAVPNDRLRAQAGRLEARRPDVDGRAAALFLWGICAEPKDLPHLARLAAPAPAPTDGGTVEAEPDEDVLGAFEAATRALLRRDTRALDEVGHMVRTCDESLLPAVVRALGRGGRPEALRLLLDLARNHPELDALAIAQVRRLGSSNDVGLDQAWGDYLRDRLSWDQDAACRVAVGALAAVRDFESIPRLIEFLEAEGGIAKDACAALREMTGLQLGADPLRWRRWFESELGWFANDYPGRRQDMRSGDLGRAVAAVREVASHRLRRDELAEELVDVLFEGDVRLQPVISTALGTLGSPRAVPMLIELLGSEELATRDAAHGALRAITGRKDLTAEPEPWLAEFDS